MEEGAWPRPSLQQEPGRGRAGRRASVLDPPTSPWEAAVLGTRALERKALQLGDSLQVLSPRGHRDRGRRPQLLCWARADFSHHRVALALRLWVLSMGSRPQGQRLGLKPMTFDLKANGVSGPETLG